MSNTFGMALMAYWNVGLNVNTLPVISLGIGFGEDYGIYIVSRMIEEYQRRTAAIFLRPSSTAWPPPARPCFTPPSWFRPGSPSGPCHRCVFKPRWATNF